MGFLATLTPDQAIESLYVSYYGRAGDSSGFNYWQQQYLDYTVNMGYSEPAALMTIADLFAYQAETQTNYAQMSDILAFQVNPIYGAGGPNSTIVGATQAFINEVYLDLFNRTADASGLAYWTGQILGWNFTTDSQQPISQIGGVILQIEDGATGNDAVTLTNKIDVAENFTDTTASAGLGFVPVPPAYLQEAQDVVFNTTSNPSTVTAQEAATATYITYANGVTYTLTIGQDSFGPGIFPVPTGNDIFKAPLGGLLGVQPTLTNGDSLVDIANPVTGTPNSILYASFNPGALFGLTGGAVTSGSFDYTAAGLNIIDIPTWYLNDYFQGAYSSSDQGPFNPSGEIYGYVYLTGDGAPGSPGQAFINGLKTLNWNAHSGGDSLILGQNGEPVGLGFFTREGSQPDANGFQIDVSNAVGNGYNGVDVDIWASDFHIGDTIVVDAESVGGFQEYNQSYEVPPPIIGTYGDPDNYDPNWVGYGQHAYAIAAGASSGGPTVTTDVGNSTAIGFTNWYVESNNGTGIGSLNILALGGEGSTSATHLKLVDDGSNTMLYATFLSDSLLSDWKNLTLIDLTNTSGFVTLTGAETTAQVLDFYRYETEDWNASTLTAFEYLGFGGLLTETGWTGTASYTSGLKILGGGNNSFYDLTGMTLTAAALSNIDGGHSTAGNSEVAFNNSVVANASVSNPAGTYINLSHIQILDDANPTQGGFINMADFLVVPGAYNTGLQPLNVDYALIAEDSPTGVPPGLPYTSADMPPSVSDNGVIPAGFYLLQLLNQDGSTATYQNSDLTIINGPWDFAVNAQDMANGYVIHDRGMDQGLGTLDTAPYTSDVTTYSDPMLGDGLGFCQPLALGGYNLYIQGQNVPPNTAAANVTVADTLKYYVSDDGARFYTDDGNSYAAYNSTDTVDHNYFLLFTASDTPVVQIANYTTVDFYLPYESLKFHGYGNSGGPNGTDTSSGDYGSDFSNYVVLGSTSFVDTPVVVADNPNGSFLNASLNFYDNQNDTGGSDPGGPDNLVLGHTNFAYNEGQSPLGLSVSDIGFDTVIIDSNTLTTTINDYGAGSFEIGATNASDLQATSTSHLIQDAPAALDYYTFNGLPGPEGITVWGSAEGQNLEQGTSGQVIIDIPPNTNEDHGSIFLTPVAGVNNYGLFALTNEGDSGPNNPGAASPFHDGPWQGQGTFVGSMTGDGYTVSYGGVGNTLEALPGPGAGQGNDVLNGGFGHDGVPNVEIGGLWPSHGNSESGGGIYFGNTGDNFFPEGGNDTVNLAHDTGHSVPDSTVWFAMYDVSNSGDSLGILHNSGVGSVYGQAVTDINTLGQEVYVNGYGPGVGPWSPDNTPLTGSTSLLTINNFIPQNGVDNHSSNSGDVINFDVNDWATGTLNYTSSSGTDYGLVQADGASLASLGTHNINADVFQVGSSTGENVSDGGANMILDMSLGYNNAAQFATGLNGSGAITLGTTADPNILSAHSIEHLLIAYATSNGNVNIDDVTLHNVTGSAIDLGSGGAGTASSGLQVTASDIITLTGLGTSLAQLHAWNIHFV